jgi:hypothetical protein
MHKNINKIKINEGSPRIIEDFLDANEIKEFQDLYNRLPIEINNKRQNILKKKWLESFSPELKKAYLDKLKKFIGDFNMDNPKSKDGLNSLGLFQESFSPVSLHVDTGFDFSKLIYKQTLLPLSSEGETIIFKNRFYGCSTTFSIDPIELKANGFNKRSSEHIQMYDKKVFDEKIHKKYLRHENIDNLKGLEVEMIYKWKLGEILIFDRTNLHCSSSNIKNKKLGLTTSTTKN